MARIFSDRSRIQAMLDVEAALARAEAACGVIPDAAARAIGAAARAENFDAETLAEDVLKGGNLAIPLVKALTALVAASDEEAARWVHWGATSQDIIDTGLVLQMREALTVIAAQLEAVGNRLATLSEDHAETPMVARTLMQQAIPTTLGFKIAGWLSALTRARQSLDALKPRLLVLQFGGAAGNLASLAPDGIRISQAMGRELRLTLPELPWHTQRDRIAEAGAALAILLGSLGKMARDLALMSQTEIGEFSEPSGGGRGGSSALPHKANPVACARIIAAAKRAPGLAATLISAMDQEHERGLGGWHAEWEVLPELFQLASGALEAACLLAEHGHFNTDRMRANLALTAGLVMTEAVSIALGRKIGKAAAHNLLERAAQKAAAEKLPLRACLEADPEIAPHFDSTELDALFAPENHLGAAPDFARQAAASWRRLSRSAQD
ncbi:MAG: 3-carboxy-cis,cis-muconate cycloisomerase [Rhodomicrobiaceae bacterium]